MNTLYWKVVVKYSLIILTITLFVTLGVVMKVIIGDPEKMIGENPIVRKAVAEINNNYREVNKLKEIENTEQDKLVESLGIDITNFKIGDL